MKFFINHLFRGVFFAGLASIGADCPGACRMNVPSKAVCIVQNEPSQCVKLKECTLNELNCERWRQKIPLLGRVKLERCSLIRTPTGSGGCAPQPPKCPNTNCSHDKVIHCVQAAGKQCRLLTNCETQRDNCSRPKNNQLTRIRASACRGIKRSDGFKPCVKQKKKKKKKSTIKKVISG
ncbi:uncharacterized protein LOC110118108 [Ceratitis capitata]|uniref:uncharacterized protein LOC110118108 n=1 Tax=Ceratitis capitata TaxID=7213 RepID=UPI000A0FFD3E|nr:uncharacterized protein LOC110118108 [Ceratitis capitata]